MGNQEVSRRKVLSGIAATGGVGAIVGHGTTALFSDEETFTNKSIDASGSAAGVVDLELDIEDLQNADGIKYSLSIPDDGNNNPSYIWVRAKTCPTPIDAADEIQVELRVECASSTYTIDSGYLIDVVDSLRTGEVLRCFTSDGDNCFEPGETVDLVLEVTDVQTDSSVDFEFKFEFYANQCRYNTGAESPWDEDDVIEACYTSDTKAISWVAFCSDGDALDADDIVELTPTVYKDADNTEPIQVEWESKVDVDTVVLKTGNMKAGDGIENFDVTGALQEGTARVGHGSDPGTAQSNSSPCPNDESGPKFEWNENEQSFEEDS